MDQSLVQLLIGAIGALITGVVTYFGRRKIQQDEDFHRETHSLNLFRALADENPRLQLAAASVLIERLRRLSAKRRKNEVDISERTAIAHALTSVLKNGPDNSSSPADGHQVSSELAKYVAEQIPKIIGAMPAKPGAKTSMMETSPMLEFDWQEAKLAGPYWKSIDARKVDFFKADLSSCGMREARLQGAVFMSAKLCDSVMRGADLTGAILSDADVHNADLEGAILANVDLTTVKNWDKIKSLTGAKYDLKTAFPDGFEPASRGMVLMGDAGKK
jgi:hypothetical protein